MGTEAVDAIRTIKRSFRALGLDEPVAISLRTRNEGLRFLSLLRHQDLVYDGGNYDGCQVEGVKIRWPRIPRRARRC